MFQPVPSAKPTPVKYTTVREEETDKWTRVAGGGEGNYATTMEKEGGGGSPWYNSNPNRMRNTSDEYRYLS